MLILLEDLVDPLDPFKNRLQLDFWNKVLRNSNAYLTVRALRAETAWLETSKALGETLKITHRLKPPPFSLSQFQKLGSTYFSKNSRRSSSEISPRGSMRSSLSAAYQSSILKAELAL